VQVGPSEHVPQSNQGKRGRHDPEAGPPGPSLPWREPDRCTQSQRDRVHRRCCCWIRPRRWKRKRNQAHHARTRKEHGRQTPIKPSPACGPIVQRQSTGAAGPCRRAADGTLHAQVAQWPHGCGQRPMQLARARCCSPATRLRSQRLPHHQSATRCVSGDNCLPRLRLVNRRQGSARVPGRPGSVRGGRLLEGAGHRDACNGVSERGRGLLAAGPGAWPHPASTRRRTHRTGGRGPSVPSLAVSEGPPVLSAFHVPKQVTTTMRELSRGTHGRLACTALSALAAWR
jgi:hypothetical protein